MILFFFVKKKTAYDLRISDWSSDVCSSDLPQRETVVELARHVGDRARQVEGRGTAPHERLAVLLRMHVDRARPEQPIAAVQRRRFDLPRSARVGDRQRPRRPRAAAGEEILDIHSSEEHTSELQSLMRIPYA